MTLLQPDDVHYRLEFDQQRSEQLVTSYRLLALLPFLLQQYSTCYTEVKGTMLKLVTHILPMPTSCCVQRHS